jgi:hypothetical protein
LEVLYVRPTQVAFHYLRVLVQHPFAFRTGIVQSSGQTSYYYALVDAGNNRVLAGLIDLWSSQSFLLYFYNFYGQFTMSGNSPNDGGVSAGSLNGPTYVSLFDGGMLVSDTGNNRVLEFPQPTLRFSVQFYNVTTQWSGSYCDKVILEFALVAPGRCFAFGNWSFSVALGPDRHQDAVQYCNGTRIFYNRYQYPPSCQIAYDSTSQTGVLFGVKLQVLVTDSTGTTKAKTTRGLIFPTGVETKETTTATTTTATTTTATTTSSILQLTNQETAPTTFPSSTSITTTSASTTTPATTTNHLVFGTPSHPTSNVKVAETTRATTSSTAATTSSSTTQSTNPRETAPTTFPSSTGTTSGASSCPITSCAITTCPSCPITSCPSCPSLAPSSTLPVAVFGVLLGALVGAGAVVVVGIVLFKKQKWPFHTHSDFDGVSSALRLRTQIQDEEEIFEDGGL